MELVQSPGVIGKAGVRSGARNRAKETERVSPWVGEGGGGRGATGKDEEGMGERAGGMEILTGKWR